MLKRSLFIAFAVLLITIGGGLTGCDALPENPHCGDGICDRKTENGWCPDCCGLTCANDGVCERFDSPYGPDCQHRQVGDCGDGRCESQEVNHCSDDCGICGDGICLPHEDGHCREDCSFNMCGDGRCESAIEAGWCRSDCYGEVGCGNGTCELHEEVYCPQDCLAGICGDGHCRGDEPLWCLRDCGIICPNEDQPTNCGDGCWPAHVNCSSPIFQCGDEEWRCTSSHNTANCCGGRFYQCAEETPYFCPASGGCVADLDDCVINTDQRCPPWLAHFCQLDGACYTTTEECTPRNTICTFLGLTCSN